MKKIVLLMCVAVLGITTANAQFEKGTKTLSGNLTGLGLGFNKVSVGGGLDDVISFGVKAKGTYFIIDKLALVGGLGFDYQNVSGGDYSNQFNLEVGGRYYLWNCMYGGLSYEGSVVKDGDYQNWGRVNVGATIYMNDRVFFEPELFFKQGIGDVDHYSTLGLSIGVGVKF